MTVYTSQFPDVPLVKESLWTYLFNTIKLDPDLPAFIDAPTGRTLTRRELRTLSLEFAHEARAQLGIHRGDTVLIFSPNSLAWPVVMFGLIAGGARATLANSAYTPAELAFQYTDSRAQTLFVHPDLVGVARETMKLVGVGEEEVRKRLVIMDLGDGAKETARKDGFVHLEDLLGKGALEEEEKFTPEQVQETLLLCYSSGTTGKPKGVETTHYNLTSVCPMAEPVHPPILRGRDVMLCVLPYYHIYGIVKLLFYPFYLGVPLVILAKFEPDAYCRAIERYRATVLFVVPPIILALVHHPAVTKYDVSTVTYLSSGAAPLGAAMVDAARAKFASVGAADVAVSQGYGLTEMSPVTHILPPKDALRKVGTTGLLLPNLEARLVEDDTEGQPVVDAKLGEAGELWVRGPTVMKGYLNNPAATRNAITPDGWFKTGDVCIIDDEGFYTIVDRKKELIKYKGFQVPPAELESLLLTHPDIVDAAVIGIDDPAQATELPRAYVVHKSGPSAAPHSFAQDVAKWVQSRVARHKFLRGGVVVIDVVPKSGAGKILRRQLRDRAKVEVNAAKEQTQTRAKL